MAPRSYTEIFGWLPQESVELLIRLIEEHGVRSVIEVGAFLGKSGAFFAGMGLEVTSVEPFARSEPYIDKTLRNRNEDQRQSFLENTRGHGIRLLEMTSQQAALEDIEADLIYLDGSHEYGDVKADIEAWYPKATKILCGDDYSPWWPGVVRAVDESPLAIVAEERLWYVAKPI